MLHPHCSFLRRTRCIIYGFRNCLHSRQQPPLQSAAEIVKDDCFIPRRPGRFNIAVGERRRILIPWQTDANFHPFLVFLQRGTLLAENIKFKVSLKANLTGI